MVNPENQLLDCIREGGWPSALALVHSQNFITKIATPGSSVFAWLITLEASIELVIALHQYAAEHESIDLNKLGLLELLCMSQVPKKMRLKYFRHYSRWD